MPRGQAPGDPITAAKELCLRLLATAPRTRAQLAAALRRRGVPERVTLDVLGRFTEAGLIDDAAFASAWVESRHHGRGLSRRALAAELLQRGVCDEDVRAAIGDLDPRQEAATARRLVSSRLSATHGQPPQVRSRRLVSLLARRGYPPGLAFRVVREALEEQGIDSLEAGLDSLEAGLDAAETGMDESGPGAPDGWPCVAGPD